jgi:hypothetical protein
MDSKNIANMKTLLLFTSLSLAVVSGYLVPRVWSARRILTKRMAVEGEEEPAATSGNGTSLANGSLSFLSSIEDENSGGMTFKQSVARIPMGPDDWDGDGDASSDIEIGNANVLSLDRYKDVNNKYFKLVDKLQPNEMLQKFAKRAPQNVQEAAKSTIVNILGTMPNYALDASLVTTNTKLANLMFQMEVTGYMLKNAEYRMSLTNALKGMPRLPAIPRVENAEGNASIALQNLGAVGSGAAVTVEGEVTLRSSDGTEVEISAAELTDALGDEVNELRKEIALLKGAREDELRANLLNYIQALPEKELSRLTSDMSDEVMESIQLLVEALMSKLGVDTSGPEVVIQQSMGVLAQLCMWQMVVGYKLRELEALEKGVDL